MTQDNNIKIKVRSLTKAFGTRKVLTGLNLDIYKGRSLVILGGSGTGKSVLIKTIIGLIEPDKGEIWFDAVNSVNISQTSRQKILESCGFLFQGGALFDSLTVKDNITFFAQKLYSLNEKDKTELASIKLRSVGLTEQVLNLYPSELSGGMQKRVSLARAIATNPEVIFFDEPTTGLDPIMANVINELIIKIREELKATTITITHDIPSAQMIGQDIALIHQGKILWTGSKAEMNKTDNPYIHQFINGLPNGPMTM